MQSIVYGASNLTPTVLRKRQCIIHGISKVSYGYDSTKNGASPGSLMLSHILSHGVMLPVDSLSKRWESVARGKEKTKSKLD